MGNEINLMSLVTICMVIYIVEKISKLRHRHAAYIWYMLWVYYGDGVFWSFVWNNWVITSGYGDKLVMMTWTIMYVNYSASYSAFRSTLVIVYLVFLLEDDKCHLSASKTATFGICIMHAHADMRSFICFVYFHKCSN
jgi:hypothetical protein